MSVKAYGSAPTIGLWSTGKDMPRIRRGLFDVMASAWNADPSIGKLGRELYTSVHAFPLEPLKAFMDANPGSLEGLQNSGVPHAVPWFLWDIDHKKDANGNKLTPDKAAELSLADAEKLVRFLMAKFGLDTSDDVFRLNLSGSKGCHVRLWNPLFNPADIEFSADAAMRHKTIAKDLAQQAGVKCDDAPYSIGNLIRLPNSRHSETGRHAVPIAAGDLLAREHVALIDPSATLWVDASQPLRTQKFLWPTGAFRESFKTQIAGLWMMAGSTTSEVSGGVVNVRQAAASKSPTESHKAFRPTYEAQQVLLNGLMTVKDQESRAVKAFRLGCQFGERGLGLKGSWSMLADAILGSGLPELEARRQFQCGWLKGSGERFPGWDDAQL